MRSQFPVARWRLLRNTLIHWERHRLSRKFHKTLLESGTFLQKKVKIGNFLRKSMSLDERTDHNSIEFAQKNGRACKLSLKIDRFCRIYQNSTATCLLIPCERTFSPNMLTKEKALQHLWIQFCWIWLNFLIH